MYHVPPIRALWVKGRSRRGGVASFEPGNDKASNSAARVFMYFAGPWNSDTLYDPAAVHDIRNSQGRIFRERLSQLACAVTTLGVASRRVPSHGSLGHRSIARRRLCLGAGSCASSGLGMFLLKNLAFKGG